MSFLNTVGYLFDRHAPKRRDVEWDGLTYVGTCRHCGAPVERHGHHDWRKRKD